MGDHLDADLDDRPEHVEIGEMDDLAVDEFPQVAEQRLVGEEAGDEEEERQSGKVSRTPRSTPKTSGIWPMAFETPKVVCSITTRMIVRPFAVSIQLMRCFETTDVLAPAIEGS